MVTSFVCFGLVTQNKGADCACLALPCVDWTRRDASGDVPAPQAVDHDGHTFAWGGNEYGQAGVDCGTAGNGVHVSLHLSVPAAVLADVRVQQVACGGMNSFAVLEHSGVGVGGRWSCRFVRACARACTRSCVYALVCVCVTPPLYTPRASCQYRF